MWKITVGIVLMEGTWMTKEVEIEAFTIEIASDKARLQIIDEDIEENLNIIHTWIYMYNYARKIDEDLGC